MKILLPLNVRLHEICIPFPSFLLTALPVTTAVHEFSSPERENCLGKCTTLPLHQMTNHCVVVYYSYCVFVHDVNCFSKAGISDSNQQVALTDEDDPFEGLIEELEKLREAHPDAVPENASDESFSAADDHVIVKASVPTDSEILTQNLGDNDDSDDEMKRKTLWKCCRMLCCIALSIDPKYKILYCSWRN